MAVMAAVGIAEPFLSGWSAAELAAAGAADASVSLDSRYFMLPLLAGIPLSAFCSLFVGAEHSSGTMRSQLTAGHGRTAVCLSHVILCVSAGALLCLAYIAAVLAAGIPLLGPPRSPLPVLLWYAFCSLMMTAALAALFAVIAMLCSSRAVAAAVCITLAYLLLFSGLYFNARLTEPEFYPERQYVEDGRIVTAEAYPNPVYVRGARRAVYQFFYDLPGCQAVQLAASASAGAPPRLPLCSLAFAALAAGAGTARFKRKDLK